MENKLYFQNLDASRFYAFMIVFLAHCFISTDPGVISDKTFDTVYHWGKVGILGLEYFFVLSSFLITMIIFEERSQTGSFNLGNFLVRRSLRVWPLYFAMVLSGYAVVVLAGYFGSEVAPLPPWHYLFFFLVNFYIISHGSEFLFFIAFLWSISVEEQFYIFWSAVMKWIRISFPLFCALMILASLVYRTFYLESDSRLFFHTVSALGNFGIGGLLAYGMRNKWRLLERVTEFPRWNVIVVYILFLASMLFYHNLMENDVFRILERLYFSLLFSFIILDQTSGKNRWFNMDRLPFATYLGKISYGLYCLHGLVITALIAVLREISIPQNLFTALFIFPLVIFLTTVLLSHLSFRYFELRFLELKKKFYTFKP